MWSWLAAAWSRLSCLCCLRTCRSSASSAPGSQRLPRSPTAEARCLTPEQHLQEFADESLTPSSAYREGATRRADSYKPVARPYLHLVGYVSLLGLFCPFAFFLTLLPLELEGLPLELGRIYYFFLTRLRFLIFSRTLMLVCVEEGPPLYATVIFLVIVWMIDAGVNFGLLPCAALSPWEFVSNFSALYFPAVFTLLQRAMQRSPLRHVLMHMLGLTLGALPPLLAAVCYSLVFHLGWGERWYLLAPTMCVWALMPMLLKLVGKTIWLPAAPAIPGLVGALWVYYCEVAFSCFGFMVFMHTPMSILGYAFSLPLLLLLYAARGTERGFRLKPCMKSVELHRATLYLDAVSASLARIAAYTLYLLLSVLKLCMPSHGLTVTRHSLLASTHRSMAFTTNIYSLQEPSVDRLLVAAAGLFLILVVHLAFELAVPRVWGQQGGGLFRLPPAPKLKRRRTAWDDPEGAELEAHFDGPLPDMASGGALRSGGANTILGHVSQDKLGVGRDESEEPASATSMVAKHGSTVSKMQHGLVLKFMVVFRLLLLAIAMFAFTLSAVIVNAVLSLLPDGPLRSCT